MSKENKEEKEQKAKKIFTITIDVYDSGDSDAYMVEYRTSKSGLGRPKAWQMTPVEFVQRVEESLGDFNKCLSDWEKAIGKEAKQFLALNSVPAIKLAQATNASASYVAEPQKEEKKPKPEKKDKKENSESSDKSENDGFEDVDFGEFDKNKDK